MKLKLPIVTAMFLMLPVPQVAQKTVATAQIVSAAETFLASLDDDQRKSVLFNFDDDEQRARWSNFPTGVVRSAGISFKKMSAPQREAAMKLLAVTLSPMGLQKVEEIRQADDDFKTNGARRGPGGGGGRSTMGGPPGGPGSPNGFGGQKGPGGPAGAGRGGPGRGPGGDMFGGDLYYFSFLGKPSTTTPWTLQYGGHHLALNITVSGSKGVLTPTLTGAQPAKFQLNGKTVRPLGRTRSTEVS